MPNNDKSLVLHYDRTRLDAIQRDGQIWLRGPQIEAPLGFTKRGAVRQLFLRHQAEFTTDETTEIVETTAGGPQSIRVFSLRGVRLLAFFARTEPAARFRRWVLDLLEGKTPVARPSGDLLERVEGPPPLAEHPMVRAALHTSAQASAVVAAAFREARQLNKQARRQAALAGLSTRELRILVERERWQASRPSMQGTFLTDG